MRSRRGPLFSILCVLCLGPRVAVDTTPPLLNVHYVRPFLFHILVTVQMNENGKVYCGALLNTGSGTSAPSVYELENNVNLRGYGKADVTANAYKQVVIVGLTPTTTYDLYCYATDLSLNGIDIAATKRAQVTTASGGDYTAPTFKYIAPFEMVDSREVRLYFQLSEDGTVWCVARRDAGLGAAAPTAGEIKNGLNVESSGSAPVRSAMQLKAEIRLGGLTEDTAYEVYCFAADMGGNGIDNTPAFAANASAIPATRRAMRTLDVLVPTSFELTTDAAPPIGFVAEPAAWNAELPRETGYGGYTPLALEAAQVVDISAWQAAPGSAADFGTGCYGLPPAPRLGGPFVALVQRGLCAFGAKALRAQRAGYQGLVVADYNATGRAAPPLQGMASAPVAGSAAPQIGIPAWLVSFDAGEDLAEALMLLGSGRVRLTIVDRYRKPTLGNQQRDHFGVRSYAAM